MPFFNTSIMKILLNWQKSGLAKTTPAGPAPMPVTALIHSRFQLDCKIKFIDFKLHVCTITLAIFMLVSVDKYS